jgi:hypothetical protein
MDIFMHISTERALQATVELILQNHDYYNMSFAHARHAFFRLLVPVLFLDNLCPAIRRIVARGQAHSGSH